MRDVELWTAAETLRRVGPLAVRADVANACRAGAIAIATSTPWPTDLVRALAALPAVVIGFGSTDDPTPEGATVLVADDPTHDVPRPWVPGGWTEVQRVADACARQTGPATVLAQLLRLGSGLDVGQALAAESLAYGLLQAGPAHRRWLAERGAASRGPEGAGGVPAGAEDTDRARVTTGNEDTDPARGVGPAPGAGTGATGGGTDPTAGADQADQAARDDSRSTTGWADRTEAFDRASPTARQPGVRTLTGAGDQRSQAGEGEPATPADPGDADSGIHAAGAVTAPAVLVSRAADVLTLELNRPERRNAYGARMRDELVAALQVVVADPTVARVELRGAGPDLSSGGDLAEFGSQGDPVAAHLLRSVANVAPLLAALADRLRVEVHGHAIGAGAELAAFAGRVVAHPDARFRLPELAMGLVPGAGGTVSLPRRIGPERTAWLALTGAELGAADAVAWGLADELTS